MTHLLRLILNTILNKVGYSIFRIGYHLISSPSEFEKHLVLKLIIRNIHLISLAIEIRGNNYFK